MDPTVTLSSLNLSLPALRILQAMQTYGYYVVDFVCTDIDIYTAIPETELDPMVGLMETQMVAEFREKFRTFCYQTNCMLWLHLRRSSKPGEIFGRPEELRVFDSYV